MTNPEQFNERYFTDTSENFEGTYHGRTLSAAVKEIQDIKKYHALRLPVGSTSERIRQIDALHIVVFDAADNIQFLQFYPEDGDGDKDKLINLAKQEIDLHQIQVELDFDSFLNMSTFLRSQELNVLGGVRVGKLLNDMRAIELVYPSSFAEATGRERLGADMVAAYMQVVYETYGKIR